MKAYRPPSIAFKFPFRRGGRSQATGSYNAPSKPGGRAPAIKQFTSMKPGRPKPKQK